MKRATLAAAAFFCGLSVAPALATDHYRDLVRSHGRPRSDAVFNAALNGCYAQTGANRSRRDTPAFKRCMATKSYRWLYASADPSPRTARVAPQESNPWSFLGSSDPAVQDEVFWSNRNAANELEEEQRNEETSVPPPAPPSP